MKKYSKLALAGMLAAAFLPLHGVQINEIRIDQPGYPDDEEYVELKGTPGESLDGVWFLYIGDHSGDGRSKGSGVVEAAYDLTGFSIPADGHFLMFGGNFDGDAFGLEAADADYFAPGFGEILENSDNVTAVLVTGWTGNGGNTIHGIDQQLGDAAVDIDDDDDAVLNTTLPWATTIDAIGLFEGPTSGEWCYGEALGFENIGPDGNFVPSHVWRGDNDNAWNFGTYDLFEVDENDNVIGLFPDGFDSPGRANPDSPPATFEPIINSLSTIFVEEGGEFSIMGYNLDTTTSVTVDGLAASFVVDGTHLDVTVPAGAMTGQVVVTNPDDTATSRNLLVVLDDLDEVVSSYDFSGGLGAATAYSVASTANWEENEFGDSFSMEANGYGADVASDDWLISPAVDLAGVANSYLILGHERVYGGPALQVKVSTNYSGSGDPNLADWTDLSVALAGDDTRQLTDTGKTDISAFDGQMIHVAIRYTSAGTGPGEGAIDRIHYFVVGGEAPFVAEWMDSDELGWVYPFVPDVTYYSFDLGWINTAEYPWVYSPEHGWLYNVIRVPGVAHWMYSPEGVWVYVHIDSGGDVHYNEGNGWILDNLVNPID